MLLLIAWLVIADIDEIARVLSFVLGCHQIRAVALNDLGVGGSRRRQHGVYFVECQFSISVHLFEPVELLVINNEYEIELALLTDLNAFLHQILRSPILGVPQMTRVDDLFECAFVPWKFGTTCTRLLLGYLFGCVH